MSEESKWIGVKDKLPLKGRHGFSNNVLTSTGMGTIKVYRYDYEFNRWTDPPHSSKITHWQPLP